MADPLLSVPGLGGWLAQRDRNMAEEGVGLSRAGTFMTMQKRAEEMALAQRAQAEREALGPNPTPEALTQWGARFSAPKDVLHYQGQRLDKQAAVEARGLELTMRAQDKRDQIEQAAREGRITREEADRRSADLRRELQGNMQMFTAGQNAAQRATQMGIAELRNAPDRPAPLKPGYARDPTDPTKQVPVPGGPAWREQSSKHSTDLQSILSVDTQTDFAMDKINRILAPNRRSDFNSNFGGYNALATQYLPGDAQTMRKEIDSFKSEMKAAGLNILRSGGGSIGAITQSEWPILEQMVDSISPMLDEKDARAAFQRIRVRLQRMRNNAKRTYDTEWGDSPFHQKDLKKLPRPGREPTTDAPPPGVEAAVWAVMTP